MTAMSQRLYERSERGFWDPAQTHLREFHDPDQVDLYPTEEDSPI